MKNWETTLVAPDASLRTAMLAIECSGYRIAIVVDGDRRLLGTLTDGDVRRALLSGSGLSDPIAPAMHRSPTKAMPGQDRRVLADLMQRAGLHQVPLVDDQGRVVGLNTIDDILAGMRRDNWVVIMAGGMGTRLSELTRDTPKPMLIVGSRPLLETIVRGYAEQGFTNFFISVNYKAEVIKSHFGDGHGLGVNIRYLNETERLGTAGPLSLLPERPTIPLVVTNADLLMKEDFGQMVDRHIAAGADATMAVRRHEMQVPFGVVREAAGRIEAIEEKPVHAFTVNAGIYVLSPRTLDLLPKASYFDMPALFESIVAGGLTGRCHHLEGYWLDIGRLADYERANSEFHEIFR
jgi:dTDP-glucose pyrophosphorylase